MSEKDESLIEKVSSREEDLVKIYKDIYPVLKNADRTDLPTQVTADLDRLDSPDRIEPSKAAAVLKSIRGSTDEDKFKFEYCYGVPMPGRKTLGEFVGDRLSEIGIGYHDFFPYLHKLGWLRKT